MAKVTSMGWIKPDNPLISNHWKMLLGSSVAPIPKQRAGIGPRAPSGIIKGGSLETKSLGTGPGLLPVQNFMRREM